MIKCILLTDTILISTIEECSSDLGEPDCKLINPFVVKKSGQDYVLEPWLFEITEQNSFMICSDKITTIFDPNQNLLSKYNSITK